MIHSVEDMKIIGSVDFSNGVELSIDNLPPDVALVDVDGALKTGIELAGRIKRHSPNVAVIIISSNPDDNQHFQALKAQAVACISKELDPDQMIDIIRRVVRGEYPINDSIIKRPGLAEQVLQRFQDLSTQSETNGLISPLTPRETEILNYVANGLINKQIAAELDISEQTIKNHVTSILRKLNANARTEAVVIAIKQGLISLA